MSRYHEDPAPWDDGEYNTGRTKPPKSHRGIIALLLIAVILLLGISSMLGVSSLKMLQELNSEPAEQTICYSTSQAETTGNLVTIDASAPIGNTNGFPPLVEAAEGMTLQDIYTKCIPSVVSITSQGRSSSSTGSGVIISDDGYIVTNNHVIDGGEQITVLLTDERTLHADVVGNDPTSDLAVLKINAEDLVSAEFGDSDLLRVGDSVVAIGDPLGIEYRGTMTNGIVSAINRNVKLDGRTMSLIQTNAALNSGNSGGPLINSSGQVIGINTIKIAAFADQAGVEGLGFAIPSTIVRDIAGQIISQGYVSGRPWLGISGESLSNFYQRYYRLPAGLYVNRVESGSTADQAGIAQGDILISVDGNNVYSQSDLDTLLYSYSAGDAVTIVIYRGGYTMQANVTLGELTNNG